MDDRILTSEEREEDVFEENIRPASILEYIGQTEVKENLNIFMQAARMRNETLDHVLLYGPPGLGKTTLSHIIANEMGAQFKVTSGPAIEHAADLAAICHEHPAPTTAPLCLAAITFYPVPPVLLTHPAQPHESLPASVHNHTSPLLPAPTAEEAT